MVGSAEAAAEAQACPCKFSTEAHVEGHLGSVVVQVEVEVATLGGVVDCGEVCEARAAAGFGLCGGLADGKSHCSPQQSTDA